MAISVPSVPEFVKRIVSSEGTRSQQERGQADLASVGVLNAVPLWACSPSASAIVGFAWPRIRLVAFSMKSR